MPNGRKDRVDITAGSSVGTSHFPTAIVEFTTVGADAPAARIINCLR